MVQKYLFANLGKFSKNNSVLHSQGMHIYNNYADIVSSLKFHHSFSPGIQIDNQLSFNEHINNICKLAVNYLNAPLKLNLLLRLGRIQ